MLEKKRPLFYSKYVIEKSLRHHVIEWCATVITIFGTFVNAHLISNGIFSSNTLAFYAWIVGDVFWITFSLKHKHWGVFATFTMLIILNIFALLKIYGTI